MLLFATRKQILYLLLWYLMTIKMPEFKVRFEFIEILKNDSS